MKDKNGLYYYPNLENKNIRMYVREHDGSVQFRLWNKDYPMIWKKHGWVDHEAIVSASKMYKEQGKTADPMALYDINMAKRLIRDE
ncbi:MAG: hypothetical protein ACLFNV_12625, partial [Desulfovibrionales bacterium]